MNGASKILTVSYGTFSCTLEGFDDPFSTMKAIAEYFRDLAADDRYFGAEPPTPDAAMLHRIAEREIQRRVEAKVGEHGVVLRAGEAQAPRVEAPAPTLAPAPVAEPVAAAAPEIAAVPTTAPQPVLATPAEASPLVESAAARLQRLRAAQAQIQAQAPVPAAPAFTPAPAPAPAPQAYAEDQEAESAFVAPVPVAAEIVEIAQPQASAEPAPSEQADESPLSRVMAALHEAPAADAAPLEAETEAEVPVLSALRETLAGLMTQDEQLAEDMAMQAVPVALVAEDSLPEDASEVETEIEDLSFAPADAELVEEAEVLAEEPAPMAESAAPLTSEAAPVATEEPVAASAELALAEEASVPEASEASLSAALSDDAPADIEVAEGAPVVAEKLQRARARVIKIRRLDKREKPVEALSPEDEADLQNTLAALEAEAKPAVVDAEVVGSAFDAPAAGDASAEKPLSGGADASVDRLLAQTNQKLEVPEIKRRRSAIAHLKAAVLATVADRRANPGARAQESEAKADPYRQDLGKVVRPSSPTGERPAPLVLVSEQRIYRKTETVADAARPMPQIVASSPAAAQPQRPVGPVRPRRLGGGNLAQAVPSADFDVEDDEALPVVIDASKQSFAEFAEQLGANSMAELLEAAGAYCTLVLERPSFTRPLLFQQVSQLPAMAEAKREDSLRNFGKLLREGRFQKTVRGQFALSESSPILTEAKRFAG